MCKYNVKLMERQNLPINLLLLQNEIKLYLNQLPFSSLKKDYTNYSQQGFCYANGDICPLWTKPQVFGQKISQGDLYHPKYEQVNVGGGFGITCPVKSLSDHHSIGKKYVPNGQYMQT